MSKSAFFRLGNTKRIVCFLLSDVIVSYFSLILSYDLRFSCQVPLEFSKEVALVFCALIALKVCALWIFKVYLVPWRFFGLSGALTIIYAHILAYGIFILLSFLGLFGSFPLSVVVIDFVISGILIGGIRISKRIYLENSPKNSPKPALIFGANTQASTLIKSALNSEIPFYPLAIIDEDEKSQGSYISNLKVYPKTALKELLEKHKIKSAILTQAYAKPPLEKLFNELTKMGIEEIKIASMLKEDRHLEDISIDDLLSRPSKDLDKEVIGSFIRNKKVLITGAGGSIGSEIVRQCVEFGAKRIILVEHSEYNLYAITEELTKKTPIKNLDKTELLRPVMVSILEKERLLPLMQEEKPDIDVHADAYKHVPLCEYTQKSEIKHHVIGNKK